MIEIHLGIMVLAAHGIIPTASPSSQSVPLIGHQDEFFFRRDLPSTTVDGGCGTPKGSAAGGALPSDLRCGRACMPMLIGEALGSMLFDVRAVGFVGRFGSIY